MWKSGRRLCRWWQRSSCLISQQVTEEYASNGNCSENSGKMQTSPMSLIFDLWHWPGDSSTSSQYTSFPANISVFWMFPLKGQGLIPAKAREWSWRVLQPPPLFPSRSQQTLPLFLCLPSGHCDARRCLLTDCSRYGWPKQPCCFAVLRCLSVPVSQLLTMLSSQAVQYRGCLCVLHVYAAKCYEPSWYCVS